MDASSHTTETSHYDITEIDTYIWMKDEGLFMAGDTGYSDMVNNNDNDIESEGEEKDASKKEKFRVEVNLPIYDKSKMKTKRGRPCGKPPTREVLNRRIKVTFYFLSWMSYL